MDYNSEDNCIQQVTTEDKDYFAFTFSTCVTAIVTAVVPSSAVSSETIVISGTGFSTNNNENMVHFGTHSCDVQTSSPTSISCLLNTTEEPLPFERFPILVTTTGLGRALVAPDVNQTGSFVLVPAITSLNLVKGSVMGGTKLVIGGQGFVSDVQVMIGDKACDVQKVSYTIIECITPISGNPQAETENEIVSLVFPKPKGSSGVCKAPNQCNFTYLQVQTPNVDNLGPLTINQPDTVLTIDGTKLSNNAADVHVMIGNESCTVLTASEIEITCNIRGLVVGSHDVRVNIKGNKGDALFTNPDEKQITSEAALTSISPTEGSLHGGLIVTINGNGFNPREDATNVVIGLVPCHIKNITTSVIKCKTSKQEEGYYLLKVTSNKQVFPTTSFQANAASTPVINSITPPDGRSGESITIEGTGFETDSSNNQIKIGKTACEVTSSTSTSITCTLLAKSAGTYPLMLDVVGKGYAAFDKNFTYQLNIDSVTPNESGFGGGKVITIQGSGFSQGAMVHICGNPCEIVKDFVVTDTTIQCEVPPKAQSSPGADDQCELVVEIPNPTNNPGMIKQTLPSAYTYKDDLTSTITAVTPARGGTGGGVTVTITGTGFSTNQSQNVVSIDGTPCLVISSTSTEIKCKTGQHGRTIKTKVRVDVGSNGAAVQTNAEFYYVDVWSSTYTWGGLSPPKEGELTEIKK